MIKWIAIFDISNGTCRKRDFQSWAFSFDAKLLLLFRMLDFSSLTCYKYLGFDVFENTILFPFNLLKQKLLLLWPVILIALDPVGINPVSLCRFSVTRKFVFNDKFWFNQNFSCSSVKFLLHWFTSVEIVGKFFEIFVDITGRRTCRWKLLIDVRFCYE